MILAALSLVHGDERMELLYFIASLMIIALPVTVFIGIAWWLARKYFRERREAAAQKAAAGSSDVG